MSHIKIDDGPSKFDLMLGLFDNKFDQPRTVSMSLGYGWPSRKGKVDMVVRTVGAEDGSGESWCVELAVGPDVYKGWYNTKTREGTLDWVNKK